MIQETKVKKRGTSYRKVVAMLQAQPTLSYGQVAKFCGVSRGRAHQIAQNAGLDKMKNKTQEQILKAAKQAAKATK